MKCFKIVLVTIFFSSILSGSFKAQVNYRIVESVIREDQTPASIEKFWLRVTDNPFGQAISIPVIAIKGKNPGPVIGIAAAIHGNELNGIAVIHRLTESINPELLNGTIIALPGVNPPGIERNQREFLDGEDLNRIFPGKTNGSESQQFVWELNRRFLPHIDYLFDLHTASFGRINSCYVRADMTDPVMSRLAKAQYPDIILHSAGEASTATAAAAKTLRAEAMERGIPTITVELGDPQVFQEEMISRTVESMYRSLSVLDMYPVTQEDESGIEIHRCSKSYWIYTTAGGYLEVFPQLKDLVDKGQLIALVRNSFGEIVGEYFAPERGIVIGKSTNPVNYSGGRILHLGILE